MNLSKICGFCVRKFTVRYGRYNYFRIGHVFGY